MKKIVALAVEHESQRYPTVGDYQDAHGITMFTVSRMADERYELLVLVHELVEKILVDARGITHESIDAFDMKYEADRPAGDDSEPGHSIIAPYHKEHVFAEKIERLLADELGVNWEHYDKTVMEL